MIIFVFATLLFFLTFPQAISTGAKNALDMCMTSVIPSLFPFMVISKILISSGRIKENNFIFRLAGRIFGISNGGVWALFLGMVCGYPMGAKIVCDLKKEKRISSQEAIRLLMFVNNSGPAFTIATVGGMFLKDIRCGVIIYFSHIIVSIITGLILSFFPVCVSVSEKITEKPPLYKVLISSITDSVASIINVTGIIVFFSAFLSIPCINGLSAFLPEGFSGVLKGMIEMTGGIKEISEAGLPMDIKVALSAFLVSFSGLSVYCQVLTFSDNIKITPCIICKVAGGIAAMFISRLFIIL